MKFIVFSFDDGRSDTYINAIPILLKHNMVGTINVVPDYVLNEKNYPQFLTTPMTREMIGDAAGKGFEIACHGYSHTNSPDDVEQNICVLKEWGIKTDGIGFASPYSELREPLSQAFINLLESGTLGYIRSGTQLKREGIVYAGLSILNDKICSNKCFYWLNRDKFVKAKEKHLLYKGITVNSYTSSREIIYLIENMPDDCALILIYHSVFDEKQMGQYNNKWTTSIQDLEAVCAFVDKCESTKAITLKQLVENA